MTFYAEQLIKDAKRRGIKNPEQILRGIKGVPTSVKEKVFKNANTQSNKNTR